VQKCFTAVLRVEIHNQSSACTTDSVTLLQNWQSCTNSVCHVWRYTHRSDKKFCWHYRNHFYAHFYIFIAHFIFLFWYSYTVPSFSIFTLLYTVRQKTAPFYWIITGTHIP